jgi:hypothetical protein
MFSLPKGGVVVEVIQRQAKMVGLEEEDLVVNGFRFQVA